MTQNMSIPNDTLTSVSPEPIHLNEIDRRNSDLTNLNDIKQRKTSFLIPALLKVQKYSSISFTVFAFLHSSSVVITPLLSVEIADELVMMTRTVYQAPGLEAILVWGSLSLHILSGIVLRWVRAYKNYKRGQERRRVKNLYIEDVNDKNKLPEDYGLGGITSLLGLGARRSFVSRTLGLSPLSFSGYLLIPFLGYHILRQRLVPLMLDGDSSFMNLSFISHLLHNKKITTYSFFTVLVWLTSYHTISGWMKYLNYYSKKSRKVAYILINGLTLAAIASLSNISSLGSSFGFVGQKFNSYINYLSL